MAWVVGVSNDFQGLLFTPSEGEEALSILLHDCAFLFGPFEVFSDLDTEELEAVYLLRCRLIDVDRGVFAPLFPVVHDQLLGLHTVG